MDPQQTNKSEWENPQNWAGPTWPSIYFSKTDTRTWVPKRVPAMGWTLNLGRTAGVFWLVGIIVAIPVLVLLATT